MSALGSEATSMPYTFVSANPLAIRKRQPNSSQAGRQAGPSPFTYDPWCRLQEQLGVKIGKAAVNSEDVAAKEEDESDKWNQEGRQQAVEALLGSCAGNDFAEESDVPQVACPAPLTFFCP